MAFPPPLWPSRLFDQNFGMCITPNDFILPFYSNYSTNYYRPWKWSMQSVTKDFGSTITNEKESFKVTLDVQHFRPGELSVKVANSQIIVEGRHEERKDEHGFISRHFTRRYALPSSCKPEDVISNLSSDGILTIIANKPKEILKDEKFVPITLCKSCPLKEETVVKMVNTEQMEKCAEIKAVDANKKNTQSMLKEDHCCLLLKPELLRDAASDTTEMKIEKKTDKVEQEKLKACQAGKNTSEILEQTLSKSCATKSAANKCDKIASKSDEVEQKVAKSCATVAASDEKFDLFDKASTAMSTSEEMLEQTFEKCSAGMSKSEKASQSRMTKSEMTGLSSMSKTESIECSTSYQASMTSNIKEISEDLSDFVSDILCSELDKTLDIKK